MFIGADDAEQVKLELREVVVLDGEGELLEVVFDELEDKASVHQREGVLDEEGKACVERVRVVPILMV